jgi:hypothetical protein
MNAPFPRDEYSNKFIIQTDKGNKLPVFLFLKENYLKIKIDFVNKIYIDKFSMQEITKNKYFLMCKNIKEAYDEILYIIKNNFSETIILEDENNNNKLILIIPIHTEKIKKAVFEINLMKDYKETLNDFSDIITNLKNDNYELKNKIYNLENKIYLLEEENKILKKEIKIIKNHLNLKIFNNNNLSNSTQLSPNRKNINLNEIKIESKILINYEDKLKIKNWLTNNKTKNITCNLLYKLSLNGKEIKTFHKLCDDKGPTLIIIETIDKEIFGGYTPLNWNGNKGDQKDTETFIFSLNTNKKYYHIKEGRSISANYMNGPTFGFYDLYFYPDMKNGKSFSPFYFLTEPILNNKEKINFKPVEIEIFQVIFED